MVTLYIFQTDTNEVKKLKKIFHTLYQIANIIRSSATSNVSESPYWSFCLSQKCATHMSAHRVQKLKQGRRHLKNDHHSTEWTEIRVTVIWGSAVPPESSIGKKR